MKVLFVCRGNTGRSQAAQAFYNKITNSMDASSAGTKVKNPNTTVENRSKSKNIINAMKRHDIDISKNLRTQLVQSDVEAYDQIIVMAEVDTIPEWLSTSEKYIYWDVKDPVDMSLEDTVKVCSQIDELVKNLLRESATL